MLRALYIITSLPSIFFRLFSYSYIRFVMDSNQSSPENDSILENLFNMLPPIQDGEQTEGNTSVSANTPILQQVFNTQSSEQVSNTNIGQCSDLNQMYTQLSQEIDNRFQQMYGTMYNFIQLEISRQLDPQNPRPSAFEGPSRQLDPQNPRPSAFEGPSRIESALETGSCSSRKRKNHRSFMSDEQHERLQSEFVKNPQPTPQHMEEVGLEINMDYEKVKNWFKNQRALKKRK